MSLFRTSAVERTITWPPVQTAIARSKHPAASVTLAIGCSVRANESDVILRNEVTKELSDLCLACLLFLTERHLKSPSRACPEQSRRGAQIFR